MTFRELLEMLKSMDQVKHSAMDHTVYFVNGDVVPLDLFESLKTGEVYFFTHITNEEADD